MAKLSAMAVDKASPKEKEYRLSDGAGLYLRVRSTGAKSWLFLFRLPDSRKVFRITLGSLEDLSLKEARARLPGLRQLVAEGSDPRNVRAATKAQNTSVMTMQALFDACRQPI